MPNDVPTHLPPRPTRTDAPTLTPVVPVDWNDRGGEPLYPVQRTKSMFDDYRIDLTKRYPRPPDVQREVAIPPPPQASTETHDVILIDAYAGAELGERPTDPVVNVMAALALVISTVYAWRTERKRRAKIRKELRAK